jgi:hypothetical protein
MPMKSLVAAVVLTAGALSPGETGDPTCDRGEFCVWDQAQYAGTVARLDLESANPDECIPLPGGMVGKSFANRLSRDVSVYQRENCSTEAEFTTYPKNGTYVPDAYFVIRAITVWEG